MTRIKKPTHFESCTDSKCKRKWCVDRMDACCYDDDHELNERKNRCIHCHTKFSCSSYGECDLHGDHGP